MKSIDDREAHFWIFCESIGQNHRHGNGAIHRLAGDFEIAMLGAEAKRCNGEPESEVGEDGFHETWGFCGKEDVTGITSDECKSLQFRVGASIREPDKKRRGKHPVPLVKNSHKKLIHES
jgi:hypothetical protein